VKIAIVSDIHANAAALQAVIDAAEATQVEVYIVLGDLIGYYYEPARTLEILRRYPSVAIAGNHERMFLASLADDAVRTVYKRKYGDGLEAAHQQLSAHEIDWLAALPHRRTVCYGGIRFDMCHGSPMDADQYVYPDASPNVLAGCRQSTHDVVLMGHTHYAMALQDQKPVLLNPGSVGQPRDCGGAAAWCLLETGVGSSGEPDCRIELRRTAYDVTAVAGAAQSRDPHLPYLSTVLTRHARG
jgi:putative phosphoesterase